MNSRNPDDYVILICVQFLRTGIKCKSCQEIEAGNSNSNNNGNNNDRDRADVTNNSNRNNNDGTLDIVIVDLKQTIKTILNKFFVEKCQTTPSTENLINLKRLTITLYKDVNKEKFYPQHEYQFAEKIFSNYNCNFNEIFKGIFYSVVIPKYLIHWIINYQKRKYDIRSSQFYMRIKILAKQNAFKLKNELPCFNIKSHEMVEEYLECYKMIKFDIENDKDIIKQCEGPTEERNTELTDLEIKLIINQKITESRVWPSIAVNAISNISEVKESNAGPSNAKKNQKKNKKKQKKQKNRK